MPHGLVSSVNIGKNVTIEDDYDETRLEIVSPPPGCSDDGKKFTCTIGVLAPGEIRTIKYTAKANVLTYTAEQIAAARSLADCGGSCSDSCSNSCGMDNCQWFCLLQS